jgi:hypothetical protein
MSALFQKQTFRQASHIEIAFPACMQYMDELETGLQTPEARSSCGLAL